MDTAGAWSGLHKKGENGVHDKKHGTRSTVKKAVAKTLKKKKEKGPGEPAPEDDEDDSEL